VDQGGGDGIRISRSNRTHGLTVAEVEGWREKFLIVAENALRTRSKDEAALTNE
jgi:hypothetical protein